MRPRHAAAVAAAAWLYLGVAAQGVAHATDVFDDFGTEDGATGLRVTTPAALASTPGTETRALVKKFERLLGRLPGTKRPFVADDLAKQLNHATSASASAGSGAGTCRATWQGEPPPPVPPEFQAPPFPADKKPFASETTKRPASAARTSPTWELTEERVAKLRSVTNGQCHLVFSINTGRSGSNYIAEMAETLTGVSAAHEPAPRSCARYMEHYTLAETYGDRWDAKVPLVYQALLNANGSAYFETCPNFKTWFWDVVLDAFLPHCQVDVVVVRRYIPSIARSIHELGWWSHKRRDGLEWMTTTNSRESRIQPLNNPKRETAWNKIIGYIILTEEFTQRFTALYEHHPCVRIFHTWSENLYTPGGSRPRSRDVSGGADGGIGSDSGGVGGGGWVGVGEDGILGLFRALGFGESFTDETLARTGHKEDKFVSDTALAKRKDKYHVETTIDDAIVHVQFYITRCIVAGIHLPHLPGLCSPGPNPKCVPLPSSEKDFHWSDEEVAQYMTITHPAPVKCCWQQRRFVLLAGVRNVGYVVKHFLQHNSKFFHAIVVLDDRSDDDTSAMLADYGVSNKLEVLVVKNQSKMPPDLHDRRDELRDRNLLVKLGRQIGGTHFAMMDYDELISENCPLDIFHNTMFGIKRQLDTLFLPWALLWGSARAQRVNPNKDRGRKNKLESGSVKRSSQKDSDEVRWKYENFMGRTESVMWVDDGKRTIDRARFDTSNGTWHVSRTPGEPLQTTNRKLPAVTTHTRHFTDYRCKIIVTHYINHDNIILKKAWYHSKTLKQLPPPPDGPCDVPPCGVNAAVSAGGAGAGDAGATKLTGKVFDNVYGASTRVVEVPASWHSNASKANAWSFLEMWRAHDVADAIRVYGYGYFDAEVRKYDFLKVEKWALAIDACGGIDACFKDDRKTMDGIGVFKLPKRDMEEASSPPAPGTRHTVGNADS